MYVLFTVLASLLFLPVLAQHFFPYLIPDALYIVRIIGNAVKMSRYQRKKPFYTLLEYFLDQVKKKPDKPFIVFEGRTYTYLDADRESNRVARALQARARLEEGDTVALFMGNEPSYVFMWLALGKLGCTAALLNYNIRSKSLMHCFSCCDARALVLSQELKDAVKEILPALREQNVKVLVLAEQSDTEGIESFQDKINQASDDPLSTALRSNITAKSAAVYIYTSGTTGRRSLPKAAMISQERVWVASVILSNAGVTSQDVIYVNLPLYHASGLFIGVTCAIERGITIVLRRKFSASQFWDDCRRHNVTVIQYIGEIMRYLCNTPKKDNDRDHKVRLAVGNGIRADVWKEFLHRFGDIKIRELYAATEGNIGFMNMSGKPGSVGRMIYLHKKLFPYALIKYDAEKQEPVRNSEGLCLEVSKGETGLLVAKISSRSPFNGYARNPQQTKEKQLQDVFQKGDLYYNTGDLMRIDEDNFFYFQDRVGDTFRWKGENVATTEVAEILLMVDYIEEATVYGVKVAGFEGRTGMAAIKIKEGKQFDPVDAFSHVVNYLPEYALPRFIRIQNSLDVTSTYKQIKMKLVDEGFNPVTIEDPLYFLNGQKKSYVPMTAEIYSAIESGDIKL
uniref:long-chain-fatty-acid--CoA ligase n=1 Tax=Scleropages formosus TaxID=113540 RepID=A0A8C9S819_SCLFO